MEDKLLGSNKYLRQAISSAINRDEWIDVGQVVIDGPMIEWKVMGRHPVSRLMLRTPVGQNPSEYHAFETRGRSVRPIHESLAWMVSRPSLMATARANTQPRMKMAHATAASARPMRCRCGDEGFHQPPPALRTDSVSRDRWRLSTAVGGEPLRQLHFAA